MREYSNFILRIESIPPAQRDDVEAYLKRIADRFPAARLSRTDLEDHGSHATFIRRKKIV
jgi:hypothetical protein